MFARSIPKDIGNLTELTLLDLSSSGLTGGIPPSISVCRSLRSVYLHGNNLTDGIASLRGLVNLQTLLLADNYFSGPLPEELGTLSNLVILDLSNNFLNGTIPTLPNLTKLVELKLDNNSFTDFEREWFLGANSPLEQPSVSLNQLKGMIPSSITNLMDLQVLKMSRNRLSGNISLELSCQLQHQFSLDLSQNQLTGNIPTELLQPFTSLCVSFNLSYNMLTGGIPIIRSSCFETLDLSHNNLSGSIPWTNFDILTGDSNVNNLWLQNNNLSGDITDVINQNPTIGSEELRLQNNHITGDLSKMINTGSEYRRVIDLSNNDLRWTASQVNPDPIQATLAILTSTPDGVLSPESLTEFQVGGNNFSGTSFPKTCFVNQTSNFPKYTLQVLDLSNSQLNGEISAALNSSCLPLLQHLNLSNNDITGSVPASIVTLPSLATLDLSNNQLSGPLPTVQFNSSLYNPSFYAGNAGLCGYFLAKCPVPLAPPGRGSTGLHWWLLLITIGGSMTVALISCLGATWHWRVYHRRHQQDADLIQTLLDRDLATLMSLRELRKATDNFAGSAQIGQGGFGTVYIGKLNDGTTVAIKRSKSEGSEQDKEQFLNEVKILSHVNHRNLVKLIGCCMENKVAVLVFEYVSNGTLQEHLKGKIGAPNPLAWNERLNITVQTADALNYLHSAATFPIYHRDVKSANILLDDDLNAKVADFGISRLAPLQATHVSTVAVQGTMGYIDPEYYTSYQLTDKSDVYSFGVVLLELISAKPTLDFLRGSEETSLVNFLSPYIERLDLKGLLDPALVETYNDLAGHGRESIHSVGRLAMTCVDMRSKARPSMLEVLKELQSSWFELSGTSKQWNSIKTDGNEDVQNDHIVLLSDTFTGDSSKFTTGGASGIQMSQLGGSASMEGNSEG